MRVPALGSVSRRRRALAKALCLASAIVLSARAAQLPLLPLPLTNEEVGASTPSKAVAASPALRVSRHALVRLSPPDHLVGSLTRIAEQDAGLDVWRSSATPCEADFSAAEREVNRGCIDLRLVHDGEDDACQIASSLLHLLPEASNSDLATMTGCRVLSEDLGGSDHRQQLSGPSSAYSAMDEPAPWLEEYHTAEE